MINHISEIMATSYGDRIRATIAPLAKKVEGKVRDTVSRVTQKVTPQKTPGSLVIK